MQQSKPEDFIINSDYATIANDGGPQSISVAFPGGTMISAGDDWVGSTNLVLGTTNASIRTTLSSSKESSTRYVCPILTLLRNATLPGPVSVTVQLTAYVTRVSDDTMQLIVTANNPYGSTMTTEAGDEVFTARINTFISPFLQA